jgi:four helix bundle protein
MGMPRDPRKLTVFKEAHQLVLDVYRLSRRFPESERYGLQAQLRRAAVSIPANLVEGSARHSARAYLHFIDIATGSAVELRYLLDLLVDLALVTAGEVGDCRNRSDHVVRALLKLQRGVQQFDVQPAPSRR